MLTPVTAYPAYPFNTTRLQSLFNSGSFVYNRYRTYSIDIMKEEYYGTRWFSWYSRRKYAAAYEAGSKDAAANAPDAS